MNHSISASTSTQLLSRQTLEPWARDWFAGEEYCPRCHATDRLTIVDTRTREARYDKWACVKCDQRWVVEIQEKETAIAAIQGITYDPTDFIDRDESEPQKSKRGLHVGKWLLAFARIIPRRRTASDTRRVSTDIDLSTARCREELLQKLVANLLASQQHDPNTFLKRAMSYAHRAIHQMTDDELRAECHRWCEEATSPSSTPPNPESAS